MADGDGVPGAGSGWKSSYIAKWANDVALAGSHAYVVDQSGAGAAASFATLSVADRASMPDPSTFTLGDILKPVVAGGAGGSGSVQTPVAGAQSPTGQAGFQTPAPMIQGGSPGGGQPIEPPSDQAGTQFTRRPIIEPPPEVTLPPDEEHHPGGIMSVEDYTKRQKHLKDVMETVTLPELPAGMTSWTEYLKSGQFHGTSEALKFATTMAEAEMNQIKVMQTQMDREYNLLKGHKLTGYPSDEEAIKTEGQLLPNIAKGPGFAAAVVGERAAQQREIDRKDELAEMTKAVGAGRVDMERAITTLMKTRDDDLRDKMGRRGQEDLTSEDMQWRSQQIEAGVDPSQLAKLNGRQSLQFDRYRDGVLKSSVIPALRTGAGNAISATSYIKATGNELRAALEPFKDSEFWNMPFDKLPERMKYAIGMGTSDDIGKLQSKFQIDKWAGTMALIRGLRRGDLIVEASKHLPQFGKDSMMLMYDKLANANDYYEHQIHETVRWGGKSGRQIDPSKVLQPPPGAKSPPPPPPGAVVLGQ